jgi:hypothetical protein
MKLEKYGYPLNCRSVLPETELNGILVISRRQRNGRDKATTLCQSFHQKDTYHCKNHLGVKKAKENIGG